MRNSIIIFMSFVVLSCGIAQDTTAPADDPQLAEITEEIESWKREMLRSTASRGSLETLLRQGVAFQKAYNAEKDSIVQSGLIEDYLRQRDAVMQKLPVTLYMFYGRQAPTTYPIAFVFEKDDLELDAKRPFILNRKIITEGAQGKRHMLFSYKESQRFVNLLSSLIGKAKANELTTVAMRDCTASIQMLGEKAVILMQLKTPAGTLSPELYQVSEFDARLLIGRIQAALTDAPPPDDYREPDDLDPGTILFGTPSGSTANKPGTPNKPNTPQQPAAASGTASTGTLSFDVTRIKVSQGKPYYYYSNMRILQQFDYRALFRWNGTQPVTAQVTMYLLGMANNKLSIIGRDVKEVTIDPGRTQELLMSAEQVIPGPTAPGVIMQCFSGGRLLRSYASTTQYKKYAEMPDIERQLPPLYQDPSSYYPTIR